MLKNLVRFIKPFIFYQTILGDKQSVSIKNGEPSFKILTVSREAYNIIGVKVDDHLYRILDTDNDYTYCQDLGKWSVYISQRFGLTDYDNALMLFNQLGVNKLTHDKFTCTITDKRIECLPTTEFSYSGYIIYPDGNTECSLHSNYYQQDVIIDKLKRFYDEEIASWFFRVSKYSQQFKLNLPQQEKEVEGYLNMFSDIVVSTDDKDKFEELTEMLISKTYSIFKLEDSDNGKVVKVTATNKEATSLDIFRFIKS